MNLHSLLNLTNPAPKPPVMPPDPGLPTDLLPAPIESWLHDTATHTNVPPAMITLPYLAGTGAVIGNRLGLQLQSTWIEYPSLWVALVTLTGGGKTPALLAARQPFNVLHKELLAATRAAGDPDLPLIITRGTWHQLQQLLPRVNGLLLHRDELRGLIQAIDRGSGETRQHYLSLWSGDVLDDATYQIIDHPVVSIVLVIHALWHPEDPATPVSRDTVDRAITLIEYLRIQLHRSLVFINQKHELRSPTDSLISRIERHLANHKPNDGWIKRSALLRKLGNAPTTLFSTALEQMLAAWSSAWFSPIEVAPPKSSVSDRILAL